MVSGFVERLILIDKGDNSTESQYYLDLEKRLSLQFSIAVTVVLLPCQALKPVLADAAQTSKGLLRVYCVDVDSEPAVAAALEVAQMPTVFAVATARSSTTSPIFLDNAVYAAKVAGSAAAEGVLEAAGYALIPGDPDDDDADAKRDKLHPTHRNLAAFELLRAAVEKALATAS
ncbi:hypothetical protein JL721_5805 [Aureococcus anophagefferens]|nr:hypothetical protein JL721_5805 [Aureococcus anophagefferens]